MVQIDGQEGLFGSKATLLVLNDVKTGAVARKSTIGGDTSLLLGGVSIVKVSHTFRGGNFCDDFMANDGCKVLGISLFSGDYPPELVRLAWLDVFGMVRERM